MKNYITSNQADILCRLIRDDFDNCPVTFRASQHMETCIELIKDLYRATGHEQFLECATQMQVDFDSDFPDFTDYEDFDPNYPENVC